MRNFSTFLIISISIFSAACTTLTPEQSAAHHARQTRAEARSQEQGIFTNNPAMLGQQSSNQAPSVIANRGH